MSLTVFEQAEIERAFTLHRAAFARKRARDRQKKQALAQFGPGGKGIPLKPDPDEPTRMTV